MNAPKPGDMVYTGPMTEVERADYQRSVDEKWRRSVEIAGLNEQQIYALSVVFTEVTGQRPQDLTPEEIGKLAYSLWHGGKAGHRYRLTVFSAGMRPWTTSI